jgi:hypothetical protein
MFKIKVVDFIKIVIWSMLCLHFLRCAGYEKLLASCKVGLVFDPYEQNKIRSTAYSIDPQ